MDFLWGLIPAVLAVWAASAVWMGWRLFWEVRKIKSDRLSSRAEDGL
jgi:hypothetical protein